MENENYPEGFAIWNEKLFNLFVEGVSTFPPELVLGTIESVKMIYMSRGAEKAYQSSENNIPDTTDLDDVNIQGPQSSEEIDDEEATK